MSPETKTLVSPHLKEHLLVLWLVNKPRGIEPYTQEGVWMVVVSPFSPMEWSYCTIGSGHVRSRQYKMLPNIARPHNFTGSQNSRTHKNGTKMLITGGRISTTAFQDTESNWVDRYKSVVSPIQTPKCFTNVTGFTGTTESSCIYITLSHILNVWT